MEAWTAIAVWHPWNHWKVSFQTLLYFCRRREAEACRRSLRPDPHRLMIDLRNIAQQLRLPADQLRLAADLLEQGYQPAFIARYRADETGHLPESVLWSLKFGIDRAQQIAAARAEALSHLGEGVELDEEVRERLDHAFSTVDIDVTLRCFRARRAAKQSGERTSQASSLLEKMIAQSQPVPDLPAWVSEQMSIDAAAAETLLQQAGRLVGTLLSGDTRLVERIRRSIQKKANVHVELIADQPAKTLAPSAAGAAAATGDQAAASSAPTTSSAADAGAPASESVGVVWSTSGDEENLGDHADPDAAEEHIDDHEHADAEVHAEAEEVATQEESTQEETSQEATQQDVTEQPVAESTPSNDEASTAPSAESSTENEISLTFESAGKKPKSGKLQSGKRKDKDSSKSAKPIAKLTPRQRRRRWLVSVLQPFKSLKKPLQRLTAYQMLMLGRGQRSQLTKIVLQYDRRPIVQMARDVFVADSHPLSGWFSTACEQALAGSLLAKIESDALAEQDESAQQHLLESATDQLRIALLQRPVRGHRILIVDTVGPKQSCVAIIDARGKCLMTEEIVCSSQPSVVSQNVIRLGELVHKHKVTLVALSNGPARRFLIHTVAELMKQSDGRNLRWTMVDRGGAEAYAAGRQASADFPQLNRRFRATVWLGRRLQDPLGELLKVDPSRLRLGSFQRELPQEPLKRLVGATLADCVCVKGVDARYGSEQQFSFVPGVSPEVAKQLGDQAAARSFTSREALTTSITGWSETGKRQALGFLRIYQSPEPLDGTLIHPDDYRLAQRLIQNTELTAPASAPEGWLPPKIKVPKPPKHSAAPATTDSSASPAADESVPVAEDAIAEQAATEATATAPSAETAPEPGTEAVPTTEAAADAASTEVAAESPAASESAPTETAQTEVDAIAPEYSEDVVIEQAKAPAIDVEKLARGWQVGRAKLAWVAGCLSNPFGDARADRPPVPMLPIVPTLSDLKPGMSVYAIVVGVAEFGAFVELGPDCGGLIHISRLSNRYIEDPHQAVQVGDLLQAWVVSVDVEKKRVALTTLSPEEQKAADEAAARQREQARAHHAEGGRPRGGDRPQGGQGRPQGQGGQQQSRSHSGGQPHGGSRGGQGQGRGGQGRGGDQRGGRPGGQQGGRGRGNRGGSHEVADVPSKPVIVKSKKPSKPISEAMQKGQEPLRSFSDLMQFYEMQRDPAPQPIITPAPPSETTEPTTPEAGEPKTE